MTGVETTIQRDAGHPDVLLSCQSADLVRIETVTTTPADEPTSGFVGRCVRLLQLDQHVAGCVLPGGISLAVERYVVNGHASVVRGFLSRTIPYFGYRTESWKRIQKARPEVIGAYAKGRFVGDRDSILAMLTTGGRNVPHNQPVPGRSSVDLLVHRC